MLVETEVIPSALCVCICVCFSMRFAKPSKPTQGQRLVCIGSQGCREGGADSGREGGVFSLYRGSPTAPHELCYYHRCCKGIWKVTHPFRGLLFPMLPSHALRTYIIFARL